MIDQDRLKLWTDWARRDDAFNFFVPSDVREMLSELERLRALSQNNAHSWDRLVRERDELLEVLKAFVAQEVDYMTINNLGDPEKQHNVKWARAVIAKRLASDHET